MNKTSLVHSKRWRALSLGVMMVLLFTSLFSSVAYGADMSDSELKDLKDVIQMRYVDPLSPEQLKGTTPEEVFSNLDPHSTYYDPDTFQRLLEQLSGSFAGIGAYVNENEGKIMITEPISGSPAEKAGLLPGDQILAVDGKSITGMDLSEAVNLIKGPVGTKVRLKIYRALTGEEFELQITRDTIVIKTVSTEIIDEEIAYLKISSFGENTYDEFFQSVVYLRELGINKLIIDIRDNGGGLLDSVADISKLLVPKGPILHVEYNNYKVSYTSRLLKPVFEDLVVLVNENSASASEILAAAVQDTQVGTIIGTNTYGKGSVQRIYFLPNGGGFKLTEARYLSPNKRVIDGIGVKPDIVVERFPATLDMENLLPLSLERDIPFNAMGDEVLAMQQRLKALGYIIEDKDGVFGVSTQKAIKSFAEANEITINGSATVKVQRALQSSFVDLVLSREYDVQLNFAVDYLKAPAAERAKAN